MFFVPPVEPTAWLPKLSVLNESVTGAVPVPERIEETGPSGALSSTVTEPVAAPTCVGSKVTPITQLAPLASVPLIMPPDIEHVVGLVALVSSAKGPEKATDLIVNAPVWLFVSLNDLVALVVPAAIEPKFEVAGVSVVCATPVPFNVIVCGLFPALSMIVSVPLGCAFVAVGVKVNARTHLAPPPANEPVVEQVLDGSSAN